MNGKDLKRAMRKQGVSVKQLARHLQTTATHIKRLQSEDSDYFYFDESKIWAEHVKKAAGWRDGSYTSQ